MMTRTEQAKRRKAIRLAVQGGESKSATMTRFNVSRDTVDKACQGQGFLSLLENNERLWVARHLCRRITALSKSRNESMLHVANALIRDGLEVESGMREAKRLIKARRDGR